LALNDYSTPQSNINVTAVMDTEGLVYFEIITKRYDQEQYINFLYRLREKIDESRVALFYDGLSVHTTKEV